MSQDTWHPRKMHPGDIVQDNMQRMGIILEVWHYNPKLPPPRCYAYKIEYLYSGNEKGVPVRASHAHNDLTLISNGIRRVTVRTILPIGERHVK